jgi:tetratricopeptide (TPR) repeat protein
MPPEHPQIGELMIELAEILFHQNKLDESIAAYKEVVRLQPHNAALRHAFGHVLERKGLRDESLATYREVIRLKSDDAEAHRHVAWLLAERKECCQVEAKEAVLSAQKAVELAPADSAGWQVLGWAHYRAGQHEAAINALNKSVELQAVGDPWQWFFLAMAHWKLSTERAEAVVSSGDPEPGATALTDEARAAHRVQAREWYAKSVEWMERKASSSEQLIRFRNEAEVLVNFVDDDSALSTATPE